MIVPKPVLSSSSSGPVGKKGNANTAKVKSGRKEAALCAAAASALPFQEPIAAWDVAAVAKWLRALGLSRIVPVCVAANTDGLVILQIVEPQEDGERERLVEALGLQPEELSRILRAGKSCRRRDILRDWGVDTDAETSRREGEANADAQNSEAVVVAAAAAVVLPAT